MVVSDEGQKKNISLFNILGQSNKKALLWNAFKERLISAFDFVDPIFDLEALTNLELK